MLDDVGNRLRAAAAWRVGDTELEKLQKPPPAAWYPTYLVSPQVLDDLGNRLRAAAAAGDVELLERLVDEVCVGEGSV